MKKIKRLFVALFAMMSLIFVATPVASATAVADTEPTP